MLASPRAKPVPYVAPFKPHALSEGREILADGPAFVLERWRGARELALDAGARMLWLVPLAGEGRIDDAPFEAGSAWLVRDGAALTLGGDSDVLVAYPGRGVIAALAD